MLSSFRRFWMNIFSKVGKICNNDNVVSVIHDSQFWYEDKYYYGETLRPGNTNEEVMDTLYVDETNTHKETWWGRG